LFDSYNYFYLYSYNYYLIMMIRMDYHI